VVQNLKLEEEADASKREENSRRRLDVVGDLSRNAKDGAVTEKENRLKWESKVRVYAEQSEAFEIIQERLSDLENRREREREAVRKGAKEREQAQKALQNAKDGVKQGENDLFKSKKMIKVAAGVKGSIGEKAGIAATKATLRAENDLIELKSNLEIAMRAEIEASNHESALSEIDQEIEETSSEMRDFKINLIESEAECTTSREVHLKPNPNPNPNSNSNSDSNSNFISNPIPDCRPTRRALTHLESLR